jgi:hypothetical protein
LANLLLARLSSRPREMAVRGRARPAKSAGKWLGQVIA